MLSKGTGAPLRVHVLGNLVANPSVEAGTTEPNDWYHSASAAEWAQVARSGGRSLRLYPVGGTADWRAAPLRSLVGPRTGYAPTSRGPVASKRS